MIDSARQNEIEKSHYREDIFYCSSNTYSFQAWCMII